jgi:hypothetical protein
MTKKCLIVHTLILCSEKKWCEKKNPNFLFLTQQPPHRTPPSDFLTPRFYCLTAKLVHTFYFYGFTHDQTWELLFSKFTSSVSLATSGSKFVRRTSQAQTFERRTAQLSLSVGGAPHKKIWAVNARSSAQTYQPISVTMPLIASPPLSPCCLQPSFALRV